MTQNNYKPNEYLISILSLSTIIAQNQQEIEFLNGTLQQQLKITDQQIINHIKKTLIKQKQIATKNNPFSFFCSNDFVDLTLGELKDAFIKSFEDKDVYSAEAIQSIIESLVHWIRHRSIIKS